MTSPFADAAFRVARGGDHHAEAVLLVESMTLDERLGCLDGDIAFWPGLVDMTNGGYYAHPWPAAVIERLGVPGIQFADGPRGAVIADGTAFPVSMARGAMFDPALEERVGDAIGLELRASRATYTGAVCMNLLRHPAWGRAQETYGEDPHHVGRMAAAFTAGLQRHVMACMKHFAANSMENARFSVDVTADERALHEVYLPHFRHVAESGVASVMSAYNSLNGEWCGENETLLTTILRNEWEWDGFVISDFIFGLRDPVKSVQAGLDIEMPFRQQRAVALSDALADGSLDVAHVERSVERTIATLLRFAAVFEHAPSAQIVNCVPHRSLAREVAAASTVMLRNQSELLPVSVAATNRVALLGHLAGAVNLGDGGSSDVKSTTVVTPLDGIRAAFDNAEVVHFDTLEDGVATQATETADLVVVVVGYTKRDEGEFIDNSGTMAMAAGLFPPMDHPEVGFAPDPQRASSATDEAVTAAPLDAESVDTDPESDSAPGPDEAAGEVGGMAPGGDRVSLRLSEADEALIAAASACNERVVVVVQCGSAVMMPWADSVSSILVTWYSGVEGGNGLGDVLTGGAEPSGRLPFAIPTSADHLVHFDKDATDETYGLLHGQWKLDADQHEAHFPFGSGRGFTTMAVGAVRSTEGGNEITVAVSNTGERDGSTVVFAHGSHDGSTVERPPERLLAFRRVHVAAGSTVEVDLDLDWQQTDVRRDGAWWVEPGTYSVHIGQFAGDRVASLSAVRSVSSEHA